MDLSLLLSAPVLALGVALLVLGLAVGFGVGQSGERKRKEADLAEAEERAIGELERLRSQHGEWVESLKLEHAGELARVRGEQADLIEKLNADNIAHLNELKREQERQAAALEERAEVRTQELEQRRRADLEALKGEHAAALTELKQEHQAALERMTADRHEALEALRHEHERALAALRGEGEQALQRAEQEAARRLEEAARQHAAEAKRQEARVAELAGERDELNAALAEREREVAKLHGDIQESRLKNMFSVSRSGERLIRVVRSVQELANELDETSRAVTDGEYSFFEAIKDQRDRETVLSLTGGGGAAASGEAPAEGSTYAAEPESGDEAPKEAAEADAAVGGAETGRPAEESETKD